ncbi:MAG: hypothetical protein ACD_36C00175G0002 [uncultured bacterium]|nr:MAG: hypothetical protein ACD_36C00175G0002 [uncultured bacterium]
MVDQFLPRPHPTGKQCKRIKNRGLVLYCLFGVHLKFLFFNNARLKVSRVFEIRLKILVEVSPVYNNFPGTKAAFATICYSQSPVEDTRDVRASSSIPTGVQVLSIVVCRKSVQFWSDSEFQPFEVFVCLLSCFSNPSAPLLNSFSGVRFFGR